MCLRLIIHFGNPAVVERIRRPVALRPRLSNGYAIFVKFLVDGEAVPSEANPRRISRNS